METLLFYARLYRLMAAQYIKARLQFKADFIISVIGMFFRDLTGFFALWIIFRSVHSLAEWSYYEIIFLYSFSLLSLTPLQLFFDQVWDLRVHVVEGTFIKYYFRPINMMFYYMAEVVDIKGFSQLVFAIIGLWYASIHIALQWTALKIVLFAILVVSSSLVMISLMIIAAVPAFWILNPFALLETMFKFRQFSRYPLSIFNSFFQRFFTCIIPVGFIAYYPVQILIRKPSLSPALVAAPFVGIVSFYLAYLFWKRGVNGYAGTGS